MTSEREPFTSDPEPFTRDGSEAAAEADGTPRRRARPNINCKLPKGLHYRLSEIIKAERRTTGVVMDKVVEDFLEAPEYEPRPYIPLELVAEDSITRNYSFAPSLYDALHERATEEGRSVQTLLLRAIHDYVRRSPDDPIKALKSDRSDPEEVQRCARS